MGNVVSMVERRKKQMDETKKKPEPAPELKPIEEAQIQAAADEVNIFQCFGDDCIRGGACKYCTGHDKYGASVMPLEMMYLAHSFRRTMGENADETQFVHVAKWAHYVQENLSTLNMILERALNVSVDELGQLSFSLNVPKNSGGDGDAH